MSPTSATAVGRPLRRSVCLFGTSANPPTGMSGHQGIVTALSSLKRRRRPCHSALVTTGADSSSPHVESAGQTTHRTSNEVKSSKDDDLPEFDEVRVVPVYRHMFADKRGNQASYDDRLHMCRLAFDGIDRVTVSDCERVCFEQKAKGLDEDEKSSLRVGSADLLDMLLTKEPNTDFSFALGADTFMDLTTFKWRRSHDVLDLLGSRLLVIYRSVEQEESRFCEHELQERIDQVNAEQRKKQNVGEDISNEKNATFATSGSTNDGPAKLLKIPTLTATSSSLVRSTSDEAVLTDLLCPKVLDFVKTNTMYSFANVE